MRAQPWSGAGRARLEGQIAFHFRPLATRKLWVRQLSLCVDLVYGANLRRGTQGCWNGCCTVSQPLKGLQCLKGLLTAAASQEAFSAEAYSNHCDAACLAETLHIQDAIAIMMTGTCQLTHLAQAACESTVNANDQYTTSQGSV